LASCTELNQILGAADGLMGKPLVSAFTMAPVTREDFEIMQVEYSKLLAQLVGATGKVYTYTYQLLCYLFNWHNLPVSEYRVFNAKHFLVAAARISSLAHTETVSSIAYLCGT
jgi:hypothetical protein